jgi:predicted transcriptional regulator
LGKGRQQNVKHPFSEIVNFPSDISETTHTTHPIPSYDNLSHPTQPIQPSKSEIIKKPVSPVNDFQKVPNSITRDGIPNKLFKGTSKNTYDALYLKTRGAIKPIRTIKATKRELMKWIGISHVTIFKHLKHLEAVGLIAIEQRMGSHDGSIYEVFIPEELHPIQPDLSHPILANTTQPIQSYENPSNVIQSNKLEWEASNNVVWDSMGNHIENKELISSSKTSLKTNTKSDDEAFAELTEVFAKACEKISGKSPNEKQKGKWRELAELLVMELEVASARTASVSDVPAFLTEHLRRRLMPVKREVAKTKTSKSTQTGNQQPSEPIEQYQAEPLSKQGRESTKQAFAGYIEKGQKEFLMGLEDSYTKEDWEWLMKELKID